MGSVYKETTVFEEAINRIREVFRYHSDVVVSMSGGKDSTVLFNIALMVAKEMNRLPLKVFWLDQEAEWQETVDYMESVMRNPDVEPYWFQIPFDFTNSLSPQSNFLRVWDEEQEKYWIHPKADISIKNNPSKYNRFHDLVQHLPEFCTAVDDCAVLVGMRIVESMNRRVAICHCGAQWRGETWCQKKNGKVQVFWPIYDFSNDDIWTAIAKNNWIYNRVYDQMYRWGVKKQQMRVSALIHETAWHSIEMLHELEPVTYNRFTARVSGVSTFNHSIDAGRIIPKDLPFAFRDWREYRDYLLEHITKPEYQDLFRKRWKGQDTDEWYKIHVREIIVNDIDGTINHDADVRMTKDRYIKEGRYRGRDQAALDKWKKESKA